MNRKGWMVIGAGFVGAFVACSNKVEITAEKGASASGSTGNATSTGSSMSTQGSGTGGASSSSTSTSTGTGAGGAASGKVVTADTDIGQYASIVLSFVPESTKVVDGPFFVTDVMGGSVLDTVTGGDCSVPQGQHTQVLALVYTGGASQIHGIRLPILTGQTLCTNVGTTVLGFRPY